MLPEQSEKETVLRAIGKTESWITSLITSHCHTLLTQQYFTLKVSLYNGYAALSSQDLDTANWMGVKINIK